MANHLPNPKPKKPIAELIPTSDIRVRTVPAGIHKELQEVSKMLRVKNVPDAVIKLISNYRGDQSSIRQLQARNTDLHQRIARYIDREAEMKSLVENFIKYTGSFNQMTIDKAKKILKQFVGTKRGSGRTGPAAPGRKSVPSKTKKGGRK